MLTLILETCSSMRLSIAILDLSAMTSTETPQQPTATPGEISEENLAHRAGAFQFNYLRVNSTPTSGTT
jgi:hypothetical protein